MNISVSILIPTYQMGKFVARAIRSALHQSFPSEKYEIVVIDDGSTDNTSRVLQSFGNDIKIITHEENKGLAAARNTGLRAARGRYVVNLDADDYIHHDLINIQHTFLTLDPWIDAVSCDYYIVDEREAHMERKSAEEFPIACGIMFRIDQLINIGLYDEDFLAREEEDVRIRFLEEYSIYNIPLPLYRYRQHGKNLTKNKELMKEQMIKLNNKHSLS
ncbi:glycosyltransferase family 2 protein [Thermodesulfobacteriota bacterium]